jgi:hypothetical protein
MGLDWLRNQGQGNSVFSKDKPEGSKDFREMCTESVP